MTGNKKTRAQARAYEVVDELPASRSRTRTEPIDWDGAKQALIENPGKWVKMVENISASTLQQLRRGVNRRFPLDELGDFEFAARRPKGADYPSNFTDLWGKYSA